jgi:SPP1 gp7 family putative phage head morphogenesis protein
VGLQLAGVLRRRVELLKAKALELLVPVLHEVGQDPDGPLVRERFDAIAPIVTARLSALELALIDPDIFGASGIDKELEEVGGKVRVANYRELKRSLGINLREADPSLAPIIDRFRERNVTRIRSIPGQALVEVTRLLESAEAQGMRVERLAELIAERFEVAASRAELIARDQVLTLNAQLVRARAESVGITEYFWTTSNDERVRAGHALLDGKRFRFNDPPIVDPETGERGNPGDPINCRCTAYPIIPEFEDDTPLDD